MGQTVTRDRPGEDAQKGVDIVDFSAGLLSDIDDLNIPVNGSPDCENVIPGLGSCEARMGWRILTKVVLGTTQDADGFAGFKDVSGTGRLMVFHGGSTYAVTIQGAVTPMSTGAYQAGKPIAASAINNKLYYSDGETITTVGSDKTGMRMYDGTTDGSFVGDVSTPGTIEIPAAKVLASYAGSLVAGNLKFTDGTYQPHTIINSNVNNAAVWYLSNGQSVAPGVGGVINCIVPFSVSTESLNLSRTIFVGKSEGNVFGLQGAFGSLTENTINISTGVLDGNTAKFIPGPDGQSGVVVFLGTDRQIYITNGVTADSLGKSRISGEVETYISDRIVLDSQTRFTSIINQKNNQYMLDLGGSRQYPFNYKDKNWTRYRGWPSGYWVAAEDQLRRPIILCCCLYEGDLIIAECNRGLDDNGEAINPYWTTPELIGEVGEGGSNGGDLNQQKIMTSVALNVQTDSSDFVVDCFADQGEGAVAQATCKISPTSASTAPATYGSATYGTQYVYAGTLVPKFGRYSRQMGIAKKNAGKPPENFKFSSVKVKVSQTTAGKKFRLNGIQIRYLPRGGFGARRRA